MRIDNNLSTSLIETAQLAVGVGIFALSSKLTHMATDTFLNCHRQWMSDCISSGIGNKQTCKQFFKNSDACQNETTLSNISSLVDIVVTLALVGTVIATQYRQIRRHGY